MARVVQRRTPPYLLIVFVILFVFSTVIAVLFFNKFNTAEEKRKILAAQRVKLISSEQEGRADISAMKDNYTKSGSSATSTVVGQLSAQVASLAGDITGSPNSTFEDAKEQIRQTFQAVNPPERRGVLKHMAEFNAQIGVKQAEIVKLNADIKRFETELAGAKKEFDDAKDGFAVSLAEKDKQIAALDVKFDSAETKHKADLDAANNTFNDAIGGYRKQIEAQAGDAKILEEKVRQLDRNCRELEKKLTPGIIDTKTVVDRSDGKVRSVIQDEGLVYLNIGTKDRVTEGLRFTVFPYTGVTSNGQGKGVVEVYNVSDNVCEARIIRQSKEAPIIAGDLVANLVYDALRDYKFVVEGNFDLNGTGEATPAGNKAVKELIRRYGGTVVDELSVSTAFVVLGDAPGRPRKPEDTDPQDAWNLYQERQKSFNRYQEMKTKAESLKIPLISSERFLDLVGYIPSKDKAD